MAVCLTLARDDVKFELLSSAVMDVVLQVVLKLFNLYGYNGTLL